MFLAENWFSFQQMTLDGNMAPPSISPTENLMKLALSSLFLLALTGGSHAALWVDFNSTNQGGGPTNAAGFQAFSRGHEVEADLGAGGNRTENYAVSFALTGDANVSLTADWPNTTDRRVRQSIDRGAGNDANWADVNLDGVTDWLGIDTRTNNGGNGNWDGTNGTPTLMTLTLSGLPAGSYSWRSFHQDTENVHTGFRVRLDTGSGYTQLADGYMSDSSPGGNPNSATDGSPGLVTNFAGMVAAGSIYDTSFTTDGSDVSFEFAPYSGALGNAVHNQLWGINGFQLTQVPEPSSSLLALLGGLFLLRRRR